MTFRPDAAAGPKTERSPGGFGRLRSTGEGGLRSQDRLAIRRKTRCGRYFQGAFGQWVAVHVGNRTGSVDPGCVGDPQVTRPDGDCHRVGYHFKSSLIGASDMACTRKKPGTDGNPTLFRHGGPGFHSPVSASACTASASAGIGGRGGTEFTATDSHPRRGSSRCCGLYFFARNRNGFARNRHGRQRHRRTGSAGTGNPRPIDPREKSLRTGTAVEKSIFVNF